MASDMMTLSTGTKSSYNKTAYRPPTEKNTSIPSNNTYSVNPFMRSDNLVVNNQENTRPLPPQVNMQNFPSLSNSSRKGRKPSSCGPKTRLTSNTGYSTATQKNQVDANTKQNTSRHIPTRVALSKKNLKTNVGVTNMLIRGLVHERHSNHHQQPNDIYFQERSRNIVAEMRYSLSPDEFEDWYEHHVEDNECQNSNDDCNYYTDDDYDYDDYDY
jgi:hypothetical protein